MYGGNPYGGAAYGASGEEILLPVAPAPGTQSEIELIADFGPVSFQVYSGTEIIVGLPTDKIKQGDVHVLQVVHRAQTSVTLSAGWVRQHQVSSGTGPNDITQDVWTFVVGATPPSSVLVTFGAAEGEKFVGGQTLRYADVNELVTAIDGVTGGEPRIEAILATFYSYSNLLQALVRGGPALSFSYSALVQRLIAANGFGFSTSNLLKRLESKGGFTYSFSDLQPVSLDPNVVSYVGGSQAADSISYTLTLNVPAETLPGDLLLLGAWGAGDQTLVVPAGWTTVYSGVVHSGTMSANHPRGSLIWMIAPDPVPATITADFLPASGGWDRAANLRVYRNVDTAAPLGATQYVARGPTFTSGLLVPGLAPATNGRRVMLIDLRSTATLELTEPEAPWNVRERTTGQRVVRAAIDALDAQRPHDQDETLWPSSTNIFHVFDVIVKAAPPP